MERQKILQWVTQGGWNWDPVLNCPLEESLILKQTRSLTPPGQAKTCLPAYSHYTENYSENLPGVQCYLDLRKINEEKVLQTLVKALYEWNKIQEFVLQVERKQVTGEIAASLPPMEGLSAQ